jgi:hypothetical protein
MEVGRWKLGDGSWELLVRAQSRTRILIND